MLDSTTSEESSDEEEMDQDVSVWESRSSPSNLSSTTKIALAAGIVKQQSNLNEYLSLVPTYSDNDFKQHFRVNRSTFACILDFLKSVDFRSEVIFHGGQHPLPVEEMLYITLVYLGNQGTFRTVADKFNRSESTILFAVEKVCACLFQHQSKIIKWPNKEEIANVVSRFKETTGFPGVVGAMDGLHIQVRPPMKDLTTYQNHKNFHSIILMCVVLPDKKFSYTFTGFPGSSKNFYVFKNSGLYDKLNSENCGGLMDQKQHHVIANSTFPLKEWLMTPYSNLTPTPQQELFDSKLHESRSIVHRTFSELKTRFKRLLNVNASVTKCVNYVVASCVIHNLCIDNGDYWDLCDDQLFVDDEEHLVYTGDQSETESAISKRNLIAATLV